MLLPGHKALLMSTLRRLSDEEVNALLGDGGGDKIIGRKHLISKKNKTFKNILKGLYYPDLPCASRSLRNGVVTHDKIKLCPLKKLLLFSTNDHLHEAYASHNGSMAYLHAMAPTPIVSVRRVRDSVVRQLLLLFAMGLHDDTTVGLDRSPNASGVPNVFWLGQALHVLMDSFSPAHTLRTKTAGDVGAEVECLRNGVMQMKSYAQNVWKANISEDDKLAMRVYDVTFKLAYVYINWKTLGMQGTRPNDDELEDWLIQEVQRALLLRKPDNEKVDMTYMASIVNYVKKSQTRKHIIDAFEVFVFEESHDDMYRVTKTLSSAISRRPPLTKDKKDKPSTDNAIMCFFNYNTQSKLWHMRNDLISSVKKYNMKKPCVEQCVWLIKEYIDAVKRVSACNDASKVLPLIRRILRTLVIKLIQGPLQIAKGFDNAPCIATPELITQCSAR